VTGFFDLEDPAERSRVSVAALTQSDDASYTSIL
jgi:hypothetical protein